MSYYSRLDYEMKANYYRDNIHLNASGHEYLANVLLAELGKRSLLNCE